MLLLLLLLLLNHRGDMRRRNQLVEMLQLVDECVLQVHQRCFARLIQRIDHCTHCLHLIQRPCHFTFFVQHVLNGSKETVQAVRRRAIRRESRRLGIGIVIRLVTRIHGRCHRRRHHRRGRHRQRFGLFRRRGKVIQIIAIRATKTRRREMQLLPRRLSRQDGPEVQMRQERAGRRSS